MESKIIEALLEQYYNGETSLEEEQRLKEFFAQQDIPVHLEHEQEMYRFYATARQERTELDINEQLFKTGKEAGRIIPLRRLRVWPALAASIFIMMGAGMYFNNSVVKKGSIYGTYSNPELAYAETQRALLLISEKLNKGTKNLDRLAELDRMENVLTNKK